MTTSPSRRLVLTRSAALVGAASSGMLLPELAMAQTGKIRVGLMLPYSGAFAPLGVAIEKFVGFFSAFSAHYYFRPVLIFIHRTHKAWYIVAQQHIVFAKWQSNGHYLFRFGFRHLKIGTCQVFKAYYFTEFSSEN